MGFFGTGGSINVLAHAQDLHKPLVLGTCIHLAPLKIFFNSRSSLCQVVKALSLLLCLGSQIVQELICKASLVLAPEIALLLKK